MNQSELINNLWERRRTENISSSETDLYYFFLHCVFSLGASNPFTFSSDSIAKFLGISRTTFVQSCKKLEDLGLIGKYKYKNLKKIGLFKFCTTVVQNLYNPNSIGNNNNSFYYIVGVDVVKSLSELTFLSITHQHFIRVVQILYNPNEKIENSKNEPFLYSKRLTDTNNDLEHFSYHFSNPRTRGRKICTTNTTIYDSRSSTDGKEKNQFNSTTEDSYTVKQVKKEKVQTSNSDDQNSSPSFSVQTEDIDTSESVDEEFNKSEFVEAERDISEDVSQVKKPVGKIEGETENWTLKETLQEKELAAPAVQVIKATLQKKKKRNSSPGSAEPPPLAVRVLWSEFDDLSTPVEKGEALSFARWFMTLLPKEMQGRITETAYKGWMVAYDQLIRIDKRTPKEIFEICKWARADRLWSTNFFSPLKLRRKDPDMVFYWDKFYVQMKKETSNGTPTKSESDERLARRKEKYGIK